MYMNININKYCKKSFFVISKNNLYTYYTQFGTDDKKNEMK